MNFLKKQYTIKTNILKEIIRGILGSIVIVLLAYLLLNSYIDKIGNAPLLNLCLWILPIVCVIKISINIFRVLLLNDTTSKEM